MMMPTAWTPPLRARNGTWDRGRTGGRGAPGRGVGTPHVRPRAQRGPPRAGRGPAAGCGAAELDRRHPHRRPAQPALRRRRPGRLGRRDLGRLRPVGRPSARPPDPAVDAYVAAGDAPVLVCLGTSAATASRAFARIADDLARDGLRSLLLVGDAANLPGLDGREGAFEFAPVTRVLPSCRVAVVSGPWAPWPPRWPPGCPSSCCRSCSTSLARRPGRGPGRGRHGAPAAPGRRGGRPHRGRPLLPGAPATWPPGWRPRTAPVPSPTPSSRCCSGRPPPAARPRRLERRFLPPGVARRQVGGDAAGEVGRALLEEAGHPLAHVGAPAQRR